MQDGRDGRALRLLVCFVAALCSACAGRQHVARAEAPPPAPPEPLPVQVAEPYEPGAEDNAEVQRGLDEICRLDPDACPSLDLHGRAARPIEQPTRPVQQSMADGPEILITGPLAGAPAASGEHAPTRVETEPVAKPPPDAKPSQRADAAPAMRDVEAKLAVEVQNIEAAAAKVRALVEAAGGQVVNDVVEDSEARYGAAISARIPTSRTHEFLHRVGQLGKLRSRKVETQDIGRRYFDAQILLRNLTNTLERYEALLQQADTVKDMAVLEANLARVRTRIEQVQGDMRWMQDRAARSTVYITLSTTLANQGQVPPKAKLWPGARAVLPVDLRANEVFAGGGVSFMGSRGFSIDVDIARSLDRDAPRRDWFAVSVGGDLYSDMLGGGQRTFVNPYLGFRGGYVHARGNNEFSGGALLGVEIYRSRFVLIDTHVQALALFGAKGVGLHAVLQPMLGAYVAF